MQPAQRERRSGRFRDRRQRPVADDLLSRQDLSFQAFLAAAASIGLPAPRTQPRRVPRCLGTGQGACGRWAACACPPRARALLTDQRQKEERRHHSQRDLALRLASQQLLLLAQRRAQPAEARQGRRAHHACCAGGEIAAWCVCIREPREQTLDRAVDDAVGAVWYTLISRSGGRQDTPELLAATAAVTVCNQTCIAQVRWRGGACQGEAGRPTRTGTSVARSTERAPTSR